MREMFYFVAFGFLFAFLIPLLIGTIIQDDGQNAWRSKQDVVTDRDKRPPAVDESTDSCVGTGYSYLLSVDGFPYVEKKNSPYIAALIDKKIVILHVDEHKNTTELGAKDKLPPEVKVDLSDVLTGCINSDRTPAKTGSVLNLKKQ